MTLYEIDQALQNCVDPETGEVDGLAFESLQMEREKKCENIALMVKDLNAEAAALRAEETQLSARRRSAEGKAERLKEFLSYALGGESFKTARVVCSYRKTTSVTVSDDFIPWAAEHAPGLLSWKEPTANKTAIKDALKKGQEVYGAEIVEGQSFSIR